MKGYQQLVRALPADLIITGSEYPAIKFKDTSTEEEKGALLTKIETGQPYIRAYSINEDLTNNGFYTNYFFPKSTVTSESDDNTHYVITQGNLYLAHPVGTCVITSTNTDPSTILGGGTWSLIDKHLPLSSFALADYVTLNSTNCSAVSGSIIRQNDMLWIYGSFTPAVAITDNTLEMFTLNLSGLGLSNVYNGYYTSMSDSGQSVYAYRINSSGLFSTYDIITRGSSSANLATGYSLAFQCIIPTAKSYRKDDSCDQFIWKRTA